jgi:ABC-type lipoprotein export system ATPase subunit
LVFNTLRTVAEQHGVAVIMVTHNEEAASYASSVLYLADGAWQTPAKDHGKV